MIYVVITAIVLAAILPLLAILKTIKEIRQSMATQEVQLQEALALLETVATGVTEILKRLNELPTDNPVIQDEIDGIRAVARNMRNQIDAQLNPPVPAPLPELEAEG